MWEEIKRKLTSRKFLAVVLVSVWWLVEGTISGVWGELGWKIVALVLGYLAAEGAKDLLAYFRSSGGE